MRHIWAIITSISFFFLFYTLWTLYDENTKIYQIKIAASGKGDTYKTAQAIAKVTHAHHDNIRVDVISTTGSLQSEKLLADGLVDLAMVQADTVVTAGSSLVALIFPDAFQLIVRGDSDIHSVADLKGKDVALSHKTSGQYRSFWTLAGHYGFTRTDIHAKSMSGSAADFALKHNAIDAIFRVRPAGNTKIKNLIHESNARLVPLSQANAMRIDQSAFVSDIIPKGAYQGYPAIPERDLETIVVYRLLIASKHLDVEVVKAITTILFEQKQELQSHIKLAGLSQKPSIESGTILPIHEGAQNYFDREEPSLVAKYVDKFGFILTITAFLGSILLQLRSHRQKVRSEKYTKRLMAIIKKSQSHQEKETLDAFASELNEMLENVHNDVNKYRIDHDGFERFSFYWEMARDEVNEELVGDEHEK